MKKAFRDTYNRELAILKERSTEFAADYPGIADRLGGLIEENLDPALQGLLEGSAFLAARVQLNIEEQFRTFTEELLEQIFPDALAPTASAMLVQANPPFANGDLEDGVSFDRGDYLDARYMDSDRRVSCRFRLSAPLTLWPLKITGVKYHARSGPIGAMGQDIAEHTKAGLVVELSRVATTGRTDGADALSGVSIDDLNVHFTGAMPEAVALYEQLFADCTRVSMRYLNAQGDPVFLRVPPESLQQIGFDEDEMLYPHDTRLFSGFALLRDAFVFPRKFLGFRLTGLKQIMPAVQASKVEIIFEFGTPNQLLAAQLELEDLQLHCAPAVNLFEESSNQIRIDRKRHEFVVTPDSSPMTHYEIHQITDVYAHYAGHQNKVRVRPLYALPPQDQDPRQTLYYTYRRKPRRLTDRERRFGTSRYRYRGTETFISLYEPPEAEEAQRLQVKTLCSNRHLPEYLPIAQGKDDFYMCEDQTVTLTCVAGPTPPRESMLELEEMAPHRTQVGDNYWRLISFLSLSHYGLENREGKGAESLREMLSLFADLGDTVTEAQISGLNAVETRPITRTIARADGYHPARGLEIRLTLDEDDFEGSGIMLLGAILDRFLAEYAAVNSFTQTVIVSRQRGVIKTFPPRSGHGPLL